jgi:antitoxin VapB
VCEHEPFLMTWRGVPIACVRHAKACAISLGVLTSSEMCHVLWHMSQCHVKLFKNGGNQAVRIHREFELPGDEATMRREGDRLVIEPAPRRTLAQVLDGLEDIEEDLPKIPPEGCRPLNVGPLAPSCRSNRPATSRTW